MEPLIKDDDIQLYLPYGDVGSFTKHNETSGFNDNYILDIASMNPTSSHGMKGCTDIFFKGLYAQLKLKSSIKRWFRIATRDARMLCLWFLSQKIEESHICKSIIVMANLW